MYDDNDNSTGKPEKYTKEQFQKMEKERFDKEARLNAEYDKIRGEIGVSQATKARRDKDIKSGQTSLLLDDPYKDPNRAEMEKRTLKEQDTKEAEKENKKTTKSGGGGGGGMPKLNRDMFKNMRTGGKVSSASKRADGCAIKGKTKGRMV
jgi:hypothetical protein